MREYRTSDGTITGLIKNSESITLDELEARRQDRDSAQRKAGEIEDLRSLMSTVGNAVLVVEEQQRREAVAQLCAAVDRSVRGPLPKASEPDALERHIMGQVPDLPSWMN